MFHSEEAEDHRRGRRSGCTITETYITAFHWPVWQEADEYCQDRRYSSGTQASFEADQI